MAALPKPLPALALALALAAPAQASIVSAASGGNALSANVALLNTPLLKLDAQAPAEGATPGTYDRESAPGLELHKSVNLVVASAQVDAGLIHGEAHYDGTTATGMGGIEDLGLGVYILGTSILSLTLDSLYSTSAVTGDYGSLTATGSSAIANGSLGLLGQNIDLAANAAANTKVDILGLLGLAGVYLTLNEQDKTCAAASCRIETNALHLWADPLALGLAGLDIKLGHSWAEMAATPSPVPLPGTWAMMLGGLGVLGAFARRRSHPA